MVLKIIDMKVVPRKIKREDRNKYLKILHAVFFSLKSGDEMKNFFNDLLTESERVMIGRRILIARMLLENKSYDDIIAKLHVGSDTIGRVHKLLEDESKKHEKTIRKLERVFNEKSKISNTNQKSEIVLTYPWLKKKYPLYFFLFNLFDNYNDK